MARFGRRGRFHRPLSWPTLTTTPPPIQFTLVQSAQNAVNPATSVAITVTSTLVGNTLIVLTAANAVVTGVTDNGSTAYTWVKDGSLNVGGKDVEIWRGLGGSGATTITVSCGSSVFIRGVVMEWSGALSLDNLPTGTSGTGTTITSPTTAQSGVNGVFVMVGYQTAYSNSGPTGTGWTALPPGTGSGSVSAYLISTDSASHSTTFGFTTSTTWVSVGASYISNMPKPVFGRYAMRRASFGR